MISAILCKHCGGDQEYRKPGRNVASSHWYCRQCDCVFQLSGAEELVALSCPSIHDHY